MCTWRRDTFKHHNTEKYFFIFLVKVHQVENTENIYNIGEIIKKSYLTIYKFKLILYKIKVHQMFKDKILCNFQGWKQQGQRECPAECLYVIIFFYSGDFQFSFVPS